MPTGVQSPSFTYTATGLGKETTFGVPVAPTAWVSAQDITMTATNAWLDRNAARNQIGMEDADTGTLGGAGAFTIESDPDVIGIPLAWAMGTEVVTTNPTVGNPAVAAQVNTTLTAAVAAGATVIPVAATTNIAAGGQILVDGYGPAPEPVTVASIATNNVTLTAPLAYAHPSGALVTAATAYDHALTLGIPRPTFTVQFNRKTDCVSFVGNKVSDWSMTLQPRALVALAFRTVYASEGISVAGTPAFSRLKPFTVIDPLTSVLVNGVATPANILTLTVSVNNGLQATEYYLGGGRIITNIPEGQTRVTGSMTIQFANDQYQQLFWGNVGATGPQSNVLPFSLSFVVYSPAYVNGVVRYGMKITMPRVRLSTAPTAGRAGGVLQQTVNFTSAQSAPNANDDIALVVTSASAVAA